jgi:hypothetical protein
MEVAMDWNLAIERNRGALKRILASLVAMVATAGGAPVLPRYLHRTMTKLLRPAESAARRLIVIAARGIKVPPPAPPPPRPPRKPKPTHAILKNGVGTGIILPRGMPAGPPRKPVQKLSLPLFDALRFPRPWRPIRRSQPRISSLDPWSVRRPVRPLPTPYDPVSGTRLTLRLQALAAALDDIPGYALRLARLRASRSAARVRDNNPQNYRPGRWRYHRDQPLKPGRPPGWRRKPKHEVHAVLNEIHGLAVWSLGEECRPTAAKSPRMGFSNDERPEP